MKLITAPELNRRTFLGAAAGAAALALAPLGAPGAAAAPKAGQGGRLIPPPEAVVLPQADVVVLPDAGQPTIDLTASAERPVPHQRD